MSKRGKNGKEREKHGMNNSNGDIKAVTRAIKGIPGVTEVVVQYDPVGRGQSGFNCGGSVMGGYLHATYVPSGVGMYRLRIGVDQRRPDVLKRINEFGSGRY